MAAVPVTVAGHLAGGGALPDAATLLLGGALVTVSARLATGSRELPWPALALLQAGAQALLHLLFAADCAPSPGARSHAVAATLPGPWMVPAHLVAASVLAWFLRQGERALWSSARRATTAVRRAAWARWRRMVDVARPLCRGDRPRAVAVVGRLGPPSVGLTRSGGLTRRGPPAVRWGSPHPA